MYEEVGRQSSAVNRLLVCLNLAALLNVVKPPKKTITAL